MAQKGKSKMIDLFVWDAQTQQVIKRLNGFHRRAVKVVRFSPDGTLLLSTGEDDDHSVAVYNWQSGSLVCSAKVDKAAVMYAAWFNNNEFVTVGVSHVKFFTIKGSKIDSKKGLLGTSGR